MQTRQGMPGEKNELNSLEMEHNLIARRISVCHNREWNLNYETEIHRVQVWGKNTMIYIRYLGWNFSDIPN